MEHHVKIRLPDVFRLMSVLGLVLVRYYHHCMFARGDVHLVLLSAIPKPWLLIRSAT